MEDVDLFIEELSKKDDNLRVIEESDTVLVFETDVDLGQVSEDEDTFEPETMMNIFVRIIRVIFVTHTVLATMITLVGFLPDEFLVVQEPAKVAVFSLICTLLMSLGLYIAMIVLREHEYALSIFYFWGFSAFLVSVSLAGVLRDISPLQFSMCVAMQSASVLIYTYISPKNVDPWRSYYIMLLVGLFGWMTGLYVFIKEQDWITAAVLLVLIVLSAAYSAVQIHYVTRYHLGEKELIKAIIQFYSDPVIYLYAKILEKIK